MHELAHGIHLTGSPMMEKARRPESVDVGRLKTRSVIK